MGGHHEHTKEIIHYLDNQSVIKRIEQSLDAKYEVPNHRLRPEQDVIDEIAATIQSLPCQIRLEWYLPGNVGHQLLFPQGKLRNILLKGTGRSLRVNRH